MREYKFSIVFCILLIFSSEAISAGDGDCILSHNDGTELTEIDWNKGITLPPINDSESMNINLLKLQVENGVTLYDFNVNGQTSKLYLHSLMKDKYLSINTGKEFGKYEEFETDTNLVIKSYFLCPNEGKKELVVIQPIIDTNNHPPVFSKPEYKFVLSMPLENGLELDFSEELVVRDVDLTNSLITFKISENEELAKKLLFKTPGRDSKNPKNYVTKLILPELVDLNENVTFTLHATDSGIPARSTTTKVTIVIDKTNTPPRFNSSLYTADLMSLDSQNFNGVKLNFLQSDVILRHVYGSIEKLEITGTSLENKNHFRVTHGDITTNNDVEISIELSYLSKRLLSQSVISMNLTATVNKMNVNTTLHIILPALQDQAENEHKVIVIILENLTFGYFSAVTTLSIFMTALLSYLFLKHYRNNRRTPTLVEDFINPDTKTGLPK